MTDSNNPVSFAASPFDPLREPEFIQKDYPFEWSPFVTVRIDGTAIDIECPRVVREEARKFYLVVANAVVQCDNTTADVRGLFRVLVNTETSNQNVETKCGEVLRRLLTKRMTEQGIASADKRIEVSTLGSYLRIPTQQTSFNVCLTSSELDTWLNNI